MIDIQLGQGDSDDIPVILKEAGIGSDLTGWVVKLLLGKYEITCLEGIKDPGTDTIVTEFADGGITVPITGAHTVDPGYMEGEFIATNGDRQVTFLNDDDPNQSNQPYFVMQVIKKLEN